jgi:RNA polymerase sigma-70 factor, ECF subfamily
MPVTPDSLYEQTLVVRSQIGDEPAFQELLGLYGPRLLAFTRRMMQNSPEQVADVIQEIWIAIYRALPGLLDVSKFRPWAFRIARDRIYREFRRRKLALVPFDDAQVESMPEASDPVVDREELDRCLDCLSPEHRETLMLRFFEEMSYEEIARVTDSVVGTVRSRIHYGKQALKKAWEGKIP